VDAVRVYADTSVFGGAYDDEFRDPSLRFFAQVRRREFLLVSSAVVEAEITRAPENVKRLFDEMLGYADLVTVTQGALDLRDAYMDAGIVGPRSADDALHVAVATDAGCTLIVSWNFQHIVHFQKIPLYNAMNVLRGYNAVSIYSPREVIEYEDEAF
jgi:predicted nucleic acid-binding protein